MDDPKVALYLIPCGMSDAPLNDVLPRRNTAILAGIRHFIVENVREARRFIKRCIPSAGISELTFFELNRHTDPADVSAYLDPLREGKPMGVISDAGCPAIADPGALPVAIAQKEGLTVIPLVGPSSILLAMMASGFNGQGFSFHGYLPIAEPERSAALKRLEADSRRFNMTQIFIETPYRNDKMLRFMAAGLNPATKICVACDITDPERESIITRTAAQWLKCIRAAEGKNGGKDGGKNEKPNGGGQLQSYDKRPAIFLIYAGEGEALQQGKNRKR